MGALAAAESAASAAVRTRPLRAASARPGRGFASRDRATGTLRDRLGVFDRDAFPAPSAQLETPVR